MSVAKVHTVNKSRKAQGRCGDCEKPIKAGDGYRWWTIGFRSRSKYKRCMACPVPPPSQRESSAAVAHILASQEMVYGALDACGSREDVVAALEDFASGISEAAETWGESADNIEQGFQHETEQSQRFREASESAESFADEVESAASNLDEYDETSEETEEEYLERIIQEARDAVDNESIEYP